MFNLFLSILRIKRLFQIGSILIKYGLYEIWDHTLFLLRPSRRHVRKQVYNTPQRIRQTIEELGPTYIKFGQIIADRPDVASEKLRRELKKLQSKARPFDTNVAISIIEKSLGQPLNELFKTFDQTPIAAASIGQVYHATLFSDKEVVVKVQRPFIESKIKLDIYLMKILARKLAKQYPELTALNICGLVDEFSQNILNELDYNNEATNTHIFEAMFKDSDTIVIPKVYSDYTSRYTIVSQYIDGETPDDRDRLIAEGFNTEQIIINGTNAIFKMVLENGIFHADPHPGNLFVLKGSRIAFIDFGMVGMLRPREMNFLADFIIGYASRNNEIMSKSLLTLCDLQYFKQSDELSFAIKQMLYRNYGTRMMELKRFSTVMQDSINILLKFNLQIPSGIFMLIKTIATLEKFAESIAPNIDLAPIVVPYAKALVKSRKSPDSIFTDIRQTIDDYMNLIKTLPNNINEILIKLKDGKIKHDIKLDDDVLFTRTARQISLRIAYVILLIGLFIGSTILIVWDSEQQFGYFILYSSSTMILLLLIKWIFIR